MFRNHINYLVENYTPISISEFSKVVTSRELYRSFAKPPVLLGFDDGFRDIITNGLPILNEFKVPAVFFVIGEILKNPDFVPWFVEVKHLIRKTRKRVFDYGIVRYDLSVQQDSVRLRHRFAASFRACRSEPERQNLLTDLAELLEVSRPMASDLDADFRFVTKEDLAALSSSALLAIASHGMTHRYLDSLTYEEQVSELEQSDGLLREHCPSYYPVVSYPLGAFNADTIAIAKRVYKAGFAVFLGTSYRNRYAYPRICINRASAQELAYTIRPIRLNYLLPLKRFLHATGVRPLR
jgi:peptidoglycan/xylan/chitin deacetylase (PgdA/CDA1 family)